jgi:hypothetical protein
MAKASTGASSKKTSAKKPAAAQKSAKKPAAKKKIAAKKAPRAKQPPTLLTTEQRRKLLKPRDDFDDLVERVARTWDTSSSLRVPNLSVSRLLNLLKRAKTAAQREQALREKMERSLRPLYDARLLAEHEVWRAVLDVNAAVKLFARSDPALGETFDFLPAALTTYVGARSSAPDPDQPETSPPGT